MLSKINADIKQAMKDKDFVVRDILRIISAKAKNIAIDRDGKNEIETQDVMSAIQKQVKQNKEAVGFLEGAKRDPSKEKREIEILTRYLPVQISAEKMKEMVSSVVGSIPVEKRNMRSKGLVMKELSVHRDALDMKKAGDYVTKLLSASCEA